MNERIQTLEIPGALLIEAAGCCMTTTAPGLDVLAVKLDTLRVDLAVELENRGKPLAPADGQPPLRRLTSARAPARDQPARLELQRSTIAMTSPRPLAGAAAARRPEHAAAQETLPLRAPGDSKPPANTPAQRPFGPARHRAPCEREHWRPAGLSQRPAPRYPGAVCLRRAVERSFVPRRRLSSSPGLPCWEPHVPGTGSDLRVTVLAVLEPRQIPRLPELGLRT
jgi:hypothetical protein